jgi:hypothetical protein
VILRVGDAANTTPQIDFTYSVGALTAGNSQTYTGTIPPTITSATTRTDPAGSDGILVVGAWTNVASTTLICSVGTLVGTSNFVGGATAGGIPGTAGITWTASAVANQLPHPGTGTTGNLTDCDGSTPRTLTARTNYTGTYTYASALTATNLDAGTYGLTVTYTATAP